MMHDTILLDPDTWDLVIDANGNIAVASPPYALAQDVASAARLKRGELRYDVNRGVPYFEEILGHTPSLSLLTGYLEEAAKSVPGVVSAQCNVTLNRSREVVGQILFIDESGADNGVNF